MKFSIFKLSTILGFLEFDRYKDPVPDYFGNPHNIGELEDSIIQNGIVHDPSNPIELVKKGKDKLITDGNHRVSVAKKLGIKEVPMIVKDYSELSQREKEIFDKKMNQRKK